MWNTSSTHVTTPRGWAEKGEGDEREARFTSLAKRLNGYTSTSSTFYNPEAALGFRGRFDCPSS
ncbi:MAG: hypothetical protein ACR2NZ_20945, partial [Rubripirellula sp.]